MYASSTEIFSNIILDSESSKIQFYYATVNTFKAHCTVIFRRSRAAHAKLNPMYFISDYVRDANM